jgi:hypothetical protein
MSPLKTQTILKPSALVLIVLVIATTVFNSCKEKDKFGTFSLVIPEIVFTTNPHTYDGKELNLIDTTVLTSIIQRLSSEGLSADVLTSIKLKKFNVSTATPGFNFNSFEYANARLAAIGMDTIVFANKAPVPQTGLTETDFDVSYDNLIDYIKKDNIFIRLVTYPKESLPAAEYRINMEFELKAKLN